MKKSNKGVMTRKGYKNKKRIDTVLKEVKRTTILIFIGFMLGLLYSNKLIYSGLIVKAQSNEDKVEVQINQEEEKLLESQKNTELESVEEIEEIETKCELDEVSCKIKEVAEAYGIDWRLAIAISRHETNEYTSYNFTVNNNVGGLWNGVKGEFYSYATLDEGIDAYIYNLKYTYIEDGLTTIETIQTRYAPIGAANDPNDLNSNWIPGVTRRYKELGGK